MCYYARTDYSCSDWKWGNMMLRCPRQHRIGETCGAKLVHSESVTKGGALCKLCEEIEIKKRRYSKTCDNISRWEREPEKFSASLEKARREANELREKIRDLHSRRPSVASNIHLQAPTTPVTNALPPISMTAAAQSYKHASPQRYSRRHNQQPQMSMGSAYMAPTSPMSMTEHSHSALSAHHGGAAYPRMATRLPSSQSLASAELQAYSMSRR